MKDRKRKIISYIFRFRRNVFCPVFVCLCVLLLAYFGNAQTKTTSRNKRQIEQIKKLNKILLRYCNLKLPESSVIDIQLKTRESKTTFIYGRIPKDEIDNFEHNLSKAHLYIEDDESRKCSNCGRIGVVGFPSDRPTEISEKWWDSDEEQAAAKRGFTIATTFGVNPNLLGRATVSLFFNPNNGRIHLFHRKWKGNVR